MQSEGVKCAVCGEEIAMRESTFEFNTLEGNPCVCELCAAKVLGVKDPQRKSDGKGVESAQPTESQ